MNRRNEHLVVIMLEKQPPGVEFEIWPLHITVVPWFPVGDETKLDQILKGVAAKHKKSLVDGGKTEVWGAKKDKYEVVLVNDSYSLHSLHWNVFHTLEKNGFPIHQKDYLGEKYTPHITIRNDRQKNLYKPSKGEIIPIGGFHLIEQIRLKKSGRMIKSVKKAYKFSRV